MVLRQTVIKRKEKKKSGLSSGFQPRKPGTGIRRGWWWHSKKKSKHCVRRSHCVDLSGRSQHWMRTLKRLASPLSQRTMKPRRNFISIKSVLFVRIDFWLFPTSRKTTNNSNPKGPPYKESHKNHQNCFKNMRRWSQKDKHYSTNPEPKGLTTHAEPLLSYRGRKAGWVLAHP